MRNSLLTLLALFSLLLFACNKPAGNQDQKQEQNQEQNENPNEGTDPNQGGNQNPADDEDLPPALVDGGVYLVTNELVEKFVTEVSYPENDYSETHILDEAYGPAAPGSADKPQKFTIRWTADPDAGAPVLRLWEGDWSREYTSLTKDSYYQVVTNLRPNAEYHYEVKTATKVLASATFTTTGHVHQLFFDKQVRNCRDLGGWKTKDGKTVKYRKVYRGGRMQDNTLNSKGRNDVLAEGIRAQLDLRGKSDVLSASPFEEFAFCAPVIEEGYSHLLQQDKAKAKQCFEFIAQCVSENKPVYFHCSLGRDRTGTVAMMVLGILGVDEGDISKEYELTQYAPHGWATSDGEKSKMTRKVDYKSAAQYIWSLANGGSFQDGMKNYLISIGVDEKVIADFQKNMLE